MKALIHEVTNALNNESVGRANSYELVLMAGLRKLDDTERKAIFLRFWLPSSIQDVSVELKISWEFADQIINRSIEKLRIHFSTFELNSSPIIGDENP